MTDRKVIDIRSGAIRKLLDGLVKAERQGKEGWEAEADRATAAVRSLPREGLLSALDGAIGGSRERRKQAVYILGRMTDAPGAMERIEEWLDSPDWNERHVLVQAIGEFDLRELAARVGRLITEDSDPFVRREAVRVAGLLRNQVNVRPLLDVVHGSDVGLVASAVFALDDLGQAAAQLHLRKIFAESVQVSDRIEAARRLARSGDQAAQEYLKQVLETPSRGPEQLKAAQAICELHGWPFRWDASEIKRTSARLANVKSPKAKKAPLSTKPERRPRAKAGATRARRKKTPK